jgi:hypothetical protein
MTDMVGRCHEDERVLMAHEQLMRNWQTAFSAEIENPSLFGHSFIEAMERQVSSSAFDPQVAS